MKAVKVQIANSSKAKELKALFTEKLGANVTCKKGTGTMRTYYCISPGKKQGYKFTDDQAELVRKTFVEIGALSALLDDYSDPKTRIHCIYQVWFQISA